MTLPAAWGLNSQSTRAGPGGVICNVPGSRDLEGPGEQMPRDDVHYPKGQHRSRNRTGETPTTAPQLTAARKADRWQLSLSKSVIDIHTEKCTILSWNV